MSFTMEDDLEGRGNIYRPYTANDRDRNSQLYSYGEVRDRHVKDIKDVRIPTEARNVVSYTIPSREPDPEPIWFVPPKKEPKYVTVEVKEEDPEPVLIMPPPKPKERVIEYQVPVKPPDPEPILVPVLPPPPEPAWVTVRQVVEEPAHVTEDYIHSKVPLDYKPHPGPIVSRIPDDYETRTSYSDTLLGVPRTIHWELVLASFILWVIMLLIAIFVAGFLS